MGAGSFHVGTTASESLAGAADAMRELVSEQVGARVLSASTAQDVLLDIDQAESDADAWFTIGEEANIDEAVSFFNILLDYSAEWPADAESVVKVLVQALEATGSVVARESAEDYVTIGAGTVEGSAEDIKEGAEKAGEAAGAGVGLLGTFFSSWHGPALVGTILLGLVAVKISADLRSVVGSR